MAQVATATTISTMPPGTAYLVGDFFDSIKSPYTRYMTDSYLGSFSAIKVPHGQRLLREKLVREKALEFVTLELR